MTPAMQTAADRQEIDPRAFRDSLGHYASGITIITGHDEQDPNALEPLLYFQGRYRRLGPDETP